MHNDFEVEGEIHQAKCPLCGDFIDVYCDDREVLECTSCGRRVHSDCFEAYQQEGQTYECCSSPGWELIDASLFLHKQEVEGLICPIGHDLIDLNNSAEELLQCTNCHTIVHRDCLEDSEGYSCCAHPDLRPCDGGFVVLSFTRNTE